MKPEYRSTSQILFGFLPEQTVDLQGGIWKVKEWRNPYLQSEIDTEILREALKRYAAPWQTKSKDGGFVQNLYKGWNIRVYTLDKENGVTVVPFPHVWMCPKCKRLHQSEEDICRCGSKGRLRQLHFVAYHDECGALRSPWIKRCPDHNDVKIEFSGTAKASEIRFVCPQCNKLIRRGFEYIKCECGNGNMTFDVHRAPRVYTPQTVVIVNPPTRAKLRKITEAGGPTKALSWVVNGMNTRTMDETPNTQESLRQQLLASGLPEATVQQMLVAAQGSAGIASADEDVVLPEAFREEAEAEAVTVALAVSESRLRIQDLAEGTDPVSELGVLYRDKYPLALEEAGLASVELLDKFPVLTGNYGYTRGSSEPGASRLVPFRHRSGDFVVYADVAETEALFLRLEPLKVADWLRGEGYALPPSPDARSARVAILQSARIPGPGDNEDTGLGTALLRLVHSYAHRFIRHAAVYAGIDRSALSELLVPLHLGVFVYAAARGDFVLGGLQAVFETELNGLLRAVARADHRCPLDPGCMRAGGACMACLHLGEPSCRYFNRYLSRETLSGGNGYLRGR